MAEVKNAADAIARATSASDAKSKTKERSREILSIFARHGFFINGLTPVELRSTLEDLGPTYVKIGQILSSRTDMLPEAFCKELEKLRSNVAPLEASVVRAIIESETGRAIDDIYAEFRDEPLGSASIAQAHYGVLADGTKVVTKVQRPGIAEMCAQDFVLLKKLAGLVGSSGDDEGGSLDLVAVLEELEKVTIEELDYHVEAAYTREFREKCIDDDTKVSCPIIIDELSTTKILTMTFVDGYSVAHRDRVEADGYDRLQICEALAENYFHQILDVGVFHADPHQGNIMVQHGVPCWIDFGMIGRVSDASIGVIQQIIFSLVMKDAEGLADAALSLTGTSKDLDRVRFVDDLDGLIRRYTSGKDLSNVDMGALLGELTDLMSSHGLKMPGEYTMLVRGLVTFEGTIAAFCPEFDLFGMLSEKMANRARESFDATASLSSLLEGIGSAGAGASQVLTLAAEALRNLAKGRTKVGIELAGYDQIAESLRAAVVNLVLAVFSCVLFAGSCVLCTTDIEPQAHGMPIFAVIGIVFAIALAIYSVKGLMKGKGR